MEGILIPLIVFAFLYLTIRMILDFKKSKMNRLSGEAEGSLGVSELKSLVREAVEEAQAPLVARLEALEERIEGRHSGLPEPEPLRDLPEPAQSEPEALLDLPEPEALLELPEPDTLPELPETEALPELPEPDHVAKRRVRKRHR